MNVLTVVSWLLLVAGTITLVVVLVRVLVGGLTGDDSPRRPSGRPGPSEHGGVPARSAALQVMDERLARGEITLEEYRTMSKILGGG
jgi:putative membrane protein